MPRATNSATLFNPINAVGLKTLANKPIDRPIDTTAVVLPDSSAVRFGTGLGTIVTTPVDSVDPVRVTSPFTRANVFGNLAVLQPWVVSVVLDQPIPRSQVTVPISDTADVSDTRLLTDPKDSTKKYYIPRYDIATHSINGQERYRIALTEAEQGGSLVIFLTKSRPPETGGAAAAEIDHQPSVELRYGSASVNEKRSFLIESEGGEVKATLTLESLTQLDEVIRALKDADYNTVVIVQRHVRVAVPAPTEQGKEQLYKVETKDIEHRAEPRNFTFDPARHPYIFSGVTRAGATGGLSYTPITVSWKGRAHHYYQKDSAPYIFKYVPDCYKLARKPKAPYAPNMLIRYNNTAGDKQGVTVDLEYVAEAVVDVARLKAAAEALKPNLPKPLPQGITAAVFEPLTVDAAQVSLRLSLPGGLSSAATRPNAISDIHTGIKDILEGLPLDTFVALYETMFGAGSAVIFTGNVIVDMGELPDEIIPFAARLNDMTGNLFEITETPNTADQTVTVTLRNAIESPIEVKEPPVSMVTEGGEVAATIGQVTAADQPTTWPVTLPPGATLTFTVHPQLPLPNGTTPDAIFNLDGVTVQPNKDAIYDAILDASVPPVYSETITVQAFAPIFTNNKLLALGFEFEGGGSVVLEPTSLIGTVALRFPLKGYVNKEVKTATYRYKQTRIDESGTPHEDAEWRVDSRTTLFPTVP